MNSKLETIIVDTFAMGTLTGDVFVELQNIFQNNAGDMGATPIAQISHRALRVLADRGFVVAHYGHNGRFDGYVPSERAQRCLFLQTAMGGRCHEPRDAFDCRLVVERPVWAEQASALGVAV